MIRFAPPLPDGCPTCFRATVHGIVFAGRERHVERMREGDAVRLVADPPGQDSPEVWVHLETGEPVGHLPPEIAAWLWPWMSRGGQADAVAVRVHGGDVPSWRRLLIEVVCRTVETEGGSGGS